MNVDPIVALESRGYTKREAAFLYLVAVHSGYFVRRQFDYFIDRVAGAIAQHFIDKARVAGHIEVIDYGHGYRVYHLFAKPIYRLLGNAESQNRRRKGDAAIRARLISLDCVLGNEQDRYLESDDERVHFFTEVRRVLPEVYCDNRGRMHTLLGSFPVALADSAHPSTSLVRFLFADEASLTVEKFSRYLTIAEPLLRAIGNFEVVYASNSNQSFPAAQQKFKKHFAPTATTQVLLSDTWHENHRPPVRNNPPLQAKFTTLLLRFSYPKLRRNEGGSLAASRPSELPTKHEVIQPQPDSNSRGSNAG